MSHRLVFTARARTDLEEITRFIVRRTGEASLAANFALKLIGKGRALADSPFKAGRPRPELGEGIRTSVFGNYLIIFTYDAEALVIARVVEGHRDLLALFRD